MPNSLIDAYRQKMAAAGQPDTRDDYDVMTDDLIPLAQQNPDLLTQYPDFAKEYDQYREASAPSLAGEFGRAFKGGMEETGATYEGLGALATGSETLKKGAQGLEAEAASNPATIPSLEDIAPGESTLGKVLSKDTARYVASKAGGALPGLLDMAGISIAGAVAGSAVEPGVGTAVGALEGPIEEAFGRGVIKSAVKSLIDEGVADKLVESGAIQDATEDGIKAAVKAGDQKVTQLVTQEAKSIAAGRSEALTNFANVYGMSAGGIYNETGDPQVSLELGAAAAAAGAPPFLSLPARVVRTMFPRLTAEAAQDAAAKLVGGKTTELLAKIGRAGVAEATGTAGMVGMEAANIVAKNITQGKDALDLDSSDWKRLREAAIGGALVSAPFAAAAGRSPHQAIDVQATEVPETPASTPTPGSAEAAPPLPEAAAAPGPRSNLEIIQALRAMSPEEQKARGAELLAKQDRTPEEETELAQLVAVAAPQEAPPSVVKAPEPVESGITTFKDAGFDTQEDFDKAYAENHEKDAFETEDEFLRRVYCQAQAA